MNAHEVAETYRSWWNANAEQIGDLFGKEVAPVGSADEVIRVAIADAMKNLRQRLVRTLHYEAACGATLARCLEDLDRSTDIVTSILRELGFSETVCGQYRESTGDEREAIVSETIRSLEDRDDLIRELVMSLKYARIRAEEPGEKIGIV